MDYITNQLNHQTGKAYHPSLAAAMKLACKKMDCYYLLTDSSTIYQIAMILHPSMKLNYFHNQKWEGEWIKEAESLVQDKYVTKYEKSANKPDVTPSMSLNMKNNDKFVSFSDLSVTTAPHVSKIQEYLNHSVKNIKDPLRWWVDNKNVYLNLHCMVLDYLSIPGMLVL
jgi:hypothetical protein